MFFGLLGGVVSLALPALIIWSIVSMARKGSSRAGREGATGSVRHFFQFAVTLGLLLITCYGVINLASLLIDRRTSAMVTDQGALALPLAFLLVGGPLLSVMVVWLRRAARSDRHMGDSGVAVLFMTFALIFSLGNTIASLTAVLEWAFGQSPSLGSSSYVGLVVWAAAWALLWRAESALVPQPRRAPHLILGSLVTAVISVIGLIFLISSALRYATGLTDEAIIGPRYGLTLTGLTLLLSAGPFWTWYWLRQARAVGQSTLWRAFVLLAGVGGGLIMGVVAASMTVYRVLVWFLGEHPADSARVYFTGVPDTLAVVAVGVGVWAYHKRLLPPGGQRTEINRTYDYILAAIGLISSAVGVSIIVVAGIEAVSRGSVLAGGAPVNTLLAAATLILVGAPVWLLTWNRVQHLPADAEHESPSRRIYLYVLFGIGGVATIVCLVIVAYLVLQDVLNSNVSSATLRGARYPIGILVSTALVAGYHWRVYRGERDVEVRVARPSKSVTLLGPSDDHITRAVADRTGARVRLWVRTDDPSLVWDAEAVVGLVEAAAGSDVLVVADPSGAFAIPFRH